MGKGKIGYIMSRFPHLPETFILREMIEMEKLGWEISVYPILLQDQAVVHPQARAFLPRAHRLSILSVSLFSSNLALFFKRPLLYLSVLAAVIYGNRTSLKFLLRALVVFPKSVEMAKRMQAEGVEHIHAHYATHPALAAWIIHRLTGIPYSVTVHAHDIFVEKSMLAEKLKGASFIAAISEFNCNYLAAYLGDWVRQKVKIVHCGIFPEDYAVPEAKNSGDRFQVFHIGSLQPYKGQRFLIQACAILHQKGIPLVCKMVGGGELQQELVAQINEMGLAGVVELLGPRTQGEIAVLLPQADCYVQPSVITASGKMEGIPVSLMEAMFCGVPVVATAISGVPELVQNEITGLLVEPENAEVLAGAMETLYRDRQKARYLAGQAKELVLQQFNLHHNARQLSTYIEDSMVNA